MPAMSDTSSVQPSLSQHVSDQSTVQHTISTRTYPQTVTATPFTNINSTRTIDISTPQTDIRHHYITSYGHRRQQYTVYSTHHSPAIQCIVHADYCDRVDFTVLEKSSGSASVVCSTNRVRECWRKGYKVVVRCRP
ncbi:uncharacterized protein LOC128173573 [Crassostrea angulata]|uniref:uncharacterized protein LOC128173573 n=1 Tax=Magallana angulata TaxID=2784310 RepID=UPI0022B08B94|nr:uncharacterized protein LOC128173573 [Crassostrea angulata]